MKSRIFRLLLTASVLGGLHQSCRPASYEILKPKRSKQVDQTGAPQQVAPTEKPIPTTPKLEANVPPTARVEVIWDGQSVTKVRVGRPVTIRPSADTVDPDDIGVSQCANPGIVKAAYDVGGEANPAVERALGCESLGAPYTFSKPGPYVIDMLVTSNENETAFARMTLIVLSADAPITESGGFTIQAVPMLAMVGQSIDLYGYCQSKKEHAIDWTFGDGSEGAGATTKHAYAAAGQYRVDATCTETAADGQTWTAALTIVVVNGATPSVPGQPIGPLPPDGLGSGEDPTPGGDDGNDGTDGGAPGQGEPGQGEPGQKPGQA